MASASTNEEKKRSGEATVRAAAARAAQAPAPSLRISRYTGIAASDIASAFSAWVRR